MKQHELLNNSLNSRILDDLKRNLAFKVELSLWFRLVDDLYKGSAVNLGDKLIETAKDLT